MKPDSLADTGILIAVPLDRVEFGQRARNSDWLGKFCPPDTSGAALEAALDERWHNAYSTLIAEPLQELVGMARCGSAEVRPQAVLPDVEILTRTKKIVILFAHWKGSEIVFDDFLHGPDIQMYLDLSQKATSPVGKWIAAKLRDHSSRTGADILLDIVNDALTVSLPDEQPVSGSVMEHAATRQARRREELERLFPNLLRPGNRLEMFDGLYSKEAVESFVAPGFNGILDLATCNSSVLADYLAARRRHQLRTVQFPNMVEFIWAAKAVTGALQLHSSGNFEYQEARNLTSEILEKVIREATGKAAQ
jgi:hypothetical protein